MDAQPARETEAWISQTLAEIAALCPPGGQIVFVSGNFNIVHPGHLRLLNFAADCGDLLVVGISGDEFGKAVLPEGLRLEGVKSTSVVDYAFTLRVLPEVFIRALKPHIVVKGKEHEQTLNAEQAAVDTYGGKLLFSSGEVRFSSFDLLQRELRETNFSPIVKPQDYPRRHVFEPRDLVPVVQSFSNLRVVVIGDLIVDEYVSCEALGMSQEDPTLVVCPLESDRFVGGAGIVAAHARGLGAKVTYFGVTGNDECAAFAARTLTKYDVACVFLTDESRPTTHKKRYRANNKTLLRVNHLRQHDIGAELIDEFYRRLIATCADVDLVIFSDFNYGMLPQPLVNRLIDYCAERGIMMVADSQASSQMGDVSRFKGMRLLTPTEHEARLAVRDNRCGLVVLADTLQRKAKADLLIITMGAEGIFIHVPGADTPYPTDRLPAFNTAPKDVSGAGDCLLTCTSMALACGADIWRSAYLGSIAAACQVGRVGNYPLTANELITELTL